MTINDKKLKQNLYKMFKIMLVINILYIIAISIYAVLNKLETMFLIKLVLSVVVGYLLSLFYLNSIAENILKSVDTNDEKLAKNNAIKSSIFRYLIVIIVISICSREFILGTASALIIVLSLIGSLFL